MSEFTGDMSAAVEAAFSSASTPDAGTTSTTESASASTTETPVESVSQEAAEPQQAETPTNTEPGPIPYPRFKEVNDKWTTASKELESLGWAKGVDPSLAQSAIQLLTRAQQNPLAFTEELESLRDHPQFGPQLRSWAARTLGFRNQPRQEMPVAETMPEPDLVFEDGRKAYSAEQLQKRDQFLLRQWESKIDEKIQPLARKGEQVDRIVAEKEFAAIQAKSQADAQSEIESLKQQYPQFWEHRDRVAEVMEANPRYTLSQAWAEVFVKDVGPKLAGQQAAAVKAKVSAGSANPQRPSGAPPNPPRDFEDALRQMFPQRT
jgi:hypothetical protein